MKRLAFLLVMGFLLTFSSLGYAAGKGKTCPTGQTRDVVTGACHSTVLTDNNREHEVTGRNASEARAFSNVNDMNANVAVGTTFPTTGEQTDTGRSPGSLDANREPSRTVGTSAAGVVPTSTSKSSAASTNEESSGSVSGM